MSAFKHKGARLAEPATSTPDVLEVMIGRKWLDPECYHGGCQSLVWKARVEKLEEVLGDLLSWFDKPADPEWRIKAGPYGADDAVEAARAELIKAEQFA